MSTVGLDYECIRDPSNSKRVAHFYDIGGDDKMADLLALSLTPSTVELSSVLICLDASRPGTIYRAAVSWMDAISRRVERCLVELEESGPEGKSTVQRMRERIFKMWEGAEWMDREPPASAPVAARGVAAVEFSRSSLREHLKRCPIPIIFVLTKWDKFSKRAEPEHIKVLTRAIRNLANIRGAGVVTSGIADGINNEHMQRLHHLVKALVLPTKQNGGANQQQFAQGIAQRNKQAQLANRRRAPMDSSDESSSDSSDSDSEGGFARGGMSTQAGPGDLPPQSPEEAYREAAAKICDDRLTAIRGFSRAFFTDDAETKGLFILPGSEKDFKIASEASRLEALDALFGDGSKETEAALARKNDAPNDAFREAAIDALVAQKQTSLLSDIQEMSRQFR